MTLTEQIDQDLKGALKAKEALKLSVLRMLKAAVSNQLIQKGAERLEDSEVLEVVAKLIKQRAESIEAFTQGNRPELAEKEKQEAEILKAYLPPPLPEAELKALIQKVIEELGASGPKAMGQVMKAVVPQVAGRADGKTVSTLVKTLLSA